MMLKRQSERSGRRFEIGMRGSLPAMLREAARRQKADGSRQRTFGPTLVGLCLLLSAFCFPPTVRAQTMTTITDTIHRPDGSLPSGQIVISSKSTFTASDGTVVFAGAVATATVTNGSFSVALIPNSGSTPSGTSYSAIYKLAGVPYREETWVVPASATPVDLAAVRSTSLNGPSTMVSASQMPALSGDVNSSAGSASASVVGLHWGSSGYTLSGAPSDGQCLTVSGFTITGGPCGSGSGQPQGSSGQVQINSGGSFAGAVGLTYDTASGATTLIAHDKGGQVFNVKAYGAKGDGVTDDTAAVNAAFAAAYAAGGGVIYFPPGIYLIAGALTVPNDGATDPKQPPYTMVGAGMQVDGGWGKPAANGSVLVLTETTNAVAKLDTRGSGYLEISGLSFTDTASDSVPFIYTTNTTLHVHDCSFTSSQTGTANVQDAIILGGSNPADIGTGNADAPFQGFGTSITHNFFAQVRHAVVGNTFANGVQIVSNTVGAGSGSSTAGDAPFKFVGYAAGANQDSGGYISGNLIEITNYYYGIRLDQYADNFVMLGNSAFDQGTNSVATYYLGAGSEAEIMSCAQVAGQSLDTSSPGAAGDNYVAFTTTQDSNGNGSYIGNNPMFPMGFTVRSGQSMKLQTLPGQETQIYEQSYSTYIQPNDGSAYDSIIDHKGQWGILNTSPQAAFDVNGNIRTDPVAFASAPACSNTNEGSMQAISDSTTATWGATITGGGTNHVMAYCDGTSWTVEGK
jgi:Pectate lyase superfamily protein